MPSSPIVWSGWQTLALPEPPTPGVLAEMLDGGQAFRDVELEAKMLKAAQQLGIGAQFGGKHFALDVRVVRLSSPEHAFAAALAEGGTLAEAAAGAEHRTALVGEKLDVSLCRTSCRRAF